MEVHKEDIQNKFHNCGLLWMWHVAKAEADISLCVGARLVDEGSSANWVETSGDRSHHCHGRVGAIQGRSGRWRKEGAAGGRRAKVIGTESMFNEILNLVLRVTSYDRRD
jgi:hypothetical protein